MIKVAFRFKSQGTEKVGLCSQGTDDSINVRYESLITLNHKYEEIAVLLAGMKRYDWKNMTIKFWYIYSNSLFRRQKVSIYFSHYFMFNTASLEISIYLGSTIMRLWYLKFWQSLIPWEKSSSFSIFGIWSWKRLWLQNLQSKVILNQSFKTIPQRQESNLWSRNSIDVLI